MSALSFLNQLVDFEKCLDPTCISWTKWWILAKLYVLYHWDEWKELIRFWWPCPNFQGHHTIKTVKMSLVCTLSPEPIGGFWPNLGKKWLDFGDLDLIFKVTPALWMSNSWHSFKIQVTNLCPSAPGICLGLEKYGLLGTNVPELPVD